MKIVCVIPARLESSRFPRKVLSMLAGKPLLQWVYEAAKSCELFDQICFAVDAAVTYDLVESFKAKAYFTDVGCKNGTERIIELCLRKEISADVWVNWQADEPFINADMMSCLLKTCRKDGADIWTFKKKIIDIQEIYNPNVVKVVTDKESNALYFSRSVIPYTKNFKGDFYKHLGIYAFSSEALSKISGLPPCDIEEKESLEQLRFLYHGLKIKVHESDHETIGIDTTEDLLKAEIILNNS